VVPALEKAGLEPGTEPIENGLAYGSEGSVIQLRNAGPHGPLMYEYRTGCRMPTAWRTSSPPREIVGSDPDMHYPYLFGGEGGRTVPPG
jgi:hypothetical protein